MNRSGKVAPIKAEKPVDGLRSRPWRRDKQKPFNFADLMAFAAASRRAGR